MITPTQCGEAVVARVAEYLGEIERKAGVLTGLAVSETRLSRLPTRGRCRGAGASRAPSDRVERGGSSLLPDSSWLGSWRRVSVVKRPP